MILRTLRAGPLQLAFNPEEGSIRYLHAGDREVVRGIAAPVRDRAWATVPPKIENLRVASDGRTFEITFDARCRDAGIDFIWRGTIKGDASGLTFDFDGEALCDFERMRIGFCVLHQAELQGAACAVEHTDGSMQRGHFPERIEPTCPFSGIRAISHEVSPGLHAEVRMEGDTFEMEDQRNWTDASFKTYCTPLSAPAPVFIRKGTRIRQRISVRLTGECPLPPPGFTPPWNAPEEVHVEIGEGSTAKLPDLGVVWNTDRPGLAILPALKTLSPAHLRADLWFGDPAFPARLRTAAEAAHAVGASLEIALFAGENFAADLGRLRRELGTLRPSPGIARWMIFHESLPVVPSDLLLLAREAFAAPPWNAPVGAGACDNFAELNRNPGVVARADFTVHACNPQVHAFDEFSIVETLGMQTLTVREARRLSGGRPAVVSPLSFTRRWRPHDRNVPVETPPNLLPLRTDPRHASPFAAAWTLGSIFALARGGAVSATYFEAVGPNGLLDVDGVSLPVAAAFARASSRRGATMHSTRSSHPLHADAMALTHDGRRQVLLANFREQPARIRITGAFGDHLFALPAFATHALDCG